MCTCACNCMWLCNSNKQIPSAEKRLVPLRHWWFPSFVCCLAVLSLCMVFPYFYYNLINPDINIIL